MAIRYPIIFKTDTKGLDKAESSLKKFGKVAAKVGAAASAAVAGIATVSVREFAKFDSALNQSVSIMGDVSDALRNDMADAAREVAKQTTFSAEQAAESFFFLASAGLDAEQSIAAMPQVARFAQAGMFDMATATDLATDAQSALGLTSDDTQENLENLTRITDVFVKANTLANTSVEQLATALTTKAGNALKTVGKDVEEGAAALAVFADQGIKGERAGTLLTNTIFGLTDIMKKAPDEAEALGIEIFNASGEMNSFASIADDMTEALSSMTKEQQIATLDQLGFTKQAREGTLALLGQADQLVEYESKLRDASGTTQEIADNQLQTAQAQFELLKSRVADVGIEIGSILVPALLELVDQITPFIERLAPRMTAFFAGLVPILQNAIGGLVAFGTLLGNFFRDVINPGIQAFLNNFESLVPVLAMGIATISAATLAFKALDIAIGFLIIKDKVLIGVQAALNAVMSANPIGLVVLAVGALATAITFVATQTTFFQDTWAKVTSFVSEAYQQYLKPTFDGLGAIVSTVFESVIKPLFDGFIAGWTAIFTAVASGYQQIILPILTAVGETFKAIFTGIVSPILEVGRQLFILLGNKYAEVFNQKIKPMLDTLGEVFSFVFENVIQPMLKRAGDFFSTFANTTGQVFENMGEAIAGVFEGLVSAIKIPLNAVIDLVNSAIGRLNSMSFTIPSIAPGEPPIRFGVNIPKIPRLAEGGIVMPTPGGILANIGEGGQPEAVIPLDRMNDFRDKPQQNINITINAGTGTDPVSVGRAVVDAIKRYEATNGKVFASA